MSKNKMAGLICCEESQAVCKAFRARGHEFYSCDIEPCSGGHPEWHIQDDVRNVLRWKKWDFIGAHPPCTYLTNANHWCYFHPDDKDVHLYLKRPHPKWPDRWKHFDEAVDFFKIFTAHPCKKKYIENPIPMKLLIERLGVSYSQIIQPYQFGHDAKKATCLWLTGLPLLLPTKTVIKRRYGNQTPSGCDRLGPSKDRAKLRSKTYTGIAAAMAAQWG